MAANLFHEVIIDLPVIIVDNSWHCVCDLFPTMFPMIYSLSRSFRIDADDDKAKLNGESIYWKRCQKSIILYIHTRDYTTTGFYLLYVIIAK